MLLLAPMAEEVGADPTSPVLETGAFAAMLLLNVYFFVQVLSLQSSVFPLCRLNFWRERRDSNPRPAD